MSNGKNVSPSTLQNTVNAQRQGKNFPKCALYHKLFQDVNIPSAILFRVPRQKQIDKMLTADKLKSSEE